jgi:ParB family transcriptional regulator, chromosome partitioning protein
MDKKARLGRGLEALLSSPTDEITANLVAVEKIEQNPHQPRRSFDQDELASLSDSIRSHGVLQPLVVRRVNGHFQLVAGERRLRAARAVGLESVPVRVVDFNDQEVLEAALVENIQRADLNPIEKALGFKEHLDRFGLTHEQLAGRLGLARTTITNLVGLLDLPPLVQDAVRTQQLSTGHAKLLKGVADKEKQTQLCKEIIARGLSVHATESLIKQPLSDASTKPQTKEDEKTVIEKTAHVQGIEDELRQKLATRVEIRLRAADKGQIILGFGSNDDFERLLEVLRK